MRYFLWFLVVAILIVGCSKSELAHEMQNVEAFPDSTSSKFDSDAESNTEPQESDAEFKQRRHVIYDANIGLEVNSFSEFRQNLPSMVFRFKGYISNVQFNQFQSRNSKNPSRRGAWELKIKSTEFEKFISELASVGTITSHHQTAKDMTSEFVDLEARITNKKRMEARVLELINQSKRSLNDVVSLERELARIRGEVERMQGRLNYIRNRTEYSTLTINASEHVQAPVVAGLPFGQRVTEAWKQSTKLLQTVVSHLVVAATYILPWLVMILTIGLPIYWFYRWVKMQMFKESMQ